MSRITVNVILILIVMAIGIASVTGAMGGPLTPRQSEKIDNFEVIAKANLGIWAVLLSISILLGTFFNGLVDKKATDQIIADNKAIIVLSIVIGLVGLIVDFFIVLLVR
ncbi:MAG: hypothetical protein ABIG84_02245 [archaeon]